MPKQDIFVIGASAGGVEALQSLAKQLPVDFPGTLLVVIHIPPRARSFLPELLMRAGPLPAKHPVNREEIEPGHIYIAPPDCHLLVERGHMHLSMGPKEQHYRPCINVLFRSAALAYGDRATGIVLTGELDDGTSGLWELKRRGGIAIVQNPETADFPSMPLSAIREVEADYVVDLDGMVPLLCRLAAGEGPGKRTEVEGTTMEARLVDLTCPDCNGNIWEVQRPNGKEYRCRVGHTFSPKSMLSQQFAAQEKALYGAIVALEEGASLASRLADEFAPEVRDALHKEAKENEAGAEAIRKLLIGRSSFTLD